jgi:hypothetical protein
MTAEKDASGRLQPLASAANANRQITVAVAAMRGKCSASIGGVMRAIRTTGNTFLALRLLSRRQFRG